MITEVCQYLRNWFNRKPDGSDYPKESGTFTVENGALVTDMLTDGQYFRVMGSLFNDGVHKYGDETDVLTDEVFDGDVWAMGVPPAVISLCEDIAKWCDKYGVETEAMSPFQSESYGGYSYTKGGSYETGGVSGWQAVFAKRLIPWRKI